MSTDETKREGNKMIGPEYRYRCPYHPTRWVFAREKWEVEGDDEELGRCEAEDEITRPCKVCVAEAEAEDLELLRLHG